MKKTVLKRVGAFLAVFVLLLALAVVPAFADTREATPPTGDVYFEWFYDYLYPQAETNATARLLDYYILRGDNSFFDYNAFVASRLHFSNAYGGFVLNNPNNFTGGDYTLIVPLEYCSIDVMVGDTNNDGQNDRYYWFSGSADMEIDYFKNDTASGGVSVRFIFNDGWIGFSYDFSNSQNGEVHYILDNVTINSTMVNARTFTTCDIAFTLSNTNTVYDIFSVINLLFDYQAYSTTQNIYSPRGFYIGVFESYNSGYNDGWRYGFDAGYDEGVTETEEEWQQKDLFQQGYMDAVEDIDSGEFGKNFLGGVFSAPIEALNSFTIIEWTTEDGGSVSISLMAILSAIVGVSLFVWFLRMFAGG